MRLFPVVLHFLLLLLFVLWWCGSILFSYYCLAFPHTQVMVSPIETAIETMDDKNKRIAMQIEQYRHNQQLRIDPLSMSLNGVVDPAVQGGIAMYKVCG